MARAEVRMNWNLVIALVDVDLDYGWGCNRYFEVAIDMLDDLLFVVV